jgi:hypothetical protein
MTNKPATEVIPGSLFQIVLKNKAAWGEPRPKQLYCLCASKQAAREWAKSILGANHEIDAITLLTTQLFSSPSSKTPVLSQFFVRGEVSVCDYGYDPTVQIVFQQVLATDEDEAEKKFREHWTSKSRAYALLYKVHDVEITEQIQ